MGLMVWLWVWILTAVPAVESSTLILAGLIGLPLLLLAPGLIRGSRYTHQLTSLLILFYFAMTLTETISNPAQRLPGMIATVLALAEFVGCVLYAKFTAITARV